ncbi:SCO3374 family protein [Streptomyces sp. NPDC056144]|uniref:SCO3374 family protein n=1 Tax=unclassified Streptomyces TaxID=2593676 RepID=UPI0035DDBA85
MAFTVPLPRSPLGDDGTGTGAADGLGDGLGDGGLMRWYERELGWTAVPGPPVQLVTGLRFDVLELPAAAGRGVLRRVGAATGPVALMGRRMRLLVAPGGAEELPGLLDWLEWGGISLDLAALGTDGRMTAPPPPGRGGSGAPGAAVWLRAPEPGREVEASLPALRSAPWGRADAPCLVRLVAAAAVECHRARLLSARARGPAPQQLSPQRLASS